MGRMFKFIDETWNPVRMKRCPNECYNNNGKTGCWANVLRETKLKSTYDKASFLTWMDKKVDFSKFNTVFVGSMCDILHYSVPTDYLKKVMAVIRLYPSTQF